MLRRNGNYSDEFESRTITLQSPNWIDCQFYMNKMYKVVILTFQAHLVVSYPENQLFSRHLELKKTINFNTLSMDDTNNINPLNNLGDL